MGPKDKEENQSFVTVGNESGEIYETEEAGKQIVEQIDEDLNQFTTLQFNSLAIKRPSLNSGNLRGLTPPDQVDNDSDSSDDESNDNEQQYVPSKFEQEQFPEPTTPPPQAPSGKIGGRKKLFSSSDSDYTESYSESSSDDPRRRKHKQSLKGVQMDRQTYE